MRRKVERTVITGRVRSVGENGACMVRRGRSITIQEMDVSSAISFERGRSGEAHQATYDAADDVFTLLGSAGISSLMKTR